MEALLAAGRAPTAADFGGMPAILGAVDVAGGSPFAPEFVALVVEEAASDELGFVADVVERVRQDIAINSLVDKLANRPPLPKAVEQRCFQAWLDLADERKCPASTRTAALRGALLMKRQDTRRALQLAGRIVASDIDDDPDYLAHAARIGGFLHAEEPSHGIVAFLGDLLAVEGASDEAGFELGMAEVGAAFEAGSPADTVQHLRQARERFETAASQREARSDAKVLSIAIGVLDDFYEERAASVIDRLGTLREEAFAYSAYSAQEGDFLAGATSIQVAAWASLAIRLETLCQTLAKPAWLDATRIIEDELLAVYSASRSIFRRASDGGLEWLVRPRIEQSLNRHRAQLYVLRDWLLERGSGALGSTAEELVARTEATLAGVRVDPPGAAAGSPTVAAVLSQGSISYDDQCRIADEVIARSWSVEREHLSPPMIEALAVVTEAFRPVPEFASNPVARSLVSAIVYKALLFLETRIDATRGMDPTVEYLFVVEGQPNPLEKDLQQDFMRFLRTAKFGSVDEWRGLAGGRADVVHYLRGVKFVTEVKREAENASFEYLLKSYGDQTALYQTTNIPLGILLVLDLTTRDGLSDHFKKLYRPVVGDLFRDGVQRGVLIIRVPARRVTPSAATVAAKKPEQDTATPHRKRKAKEPSKSATTKA